MRVSANFGPLLGAVATGAALVFAAPPWNAAGLAWIAFWPLLRTLPPARWWRRLVLGSIAGLVWSLGTVAPWLYPAARVHLAAGAAGAAAITFLATWMWGGVYLATLAVIYPRLPRPWWLSRPATWVMGEALRSHLLGGAPWSLLGHSQHDVAWVRQLAEIGGVSGLSFLIAMPSAALASPPGDRRTGLIVAGGLALAAIGFGASRGAPAMAPGTPLQIHILSGANADRNAVARYADETRNRPADLTIWPESSTPGYIQEEPETRAQLTSAARTGGWLLVGTHRHEGLGADRRYFNAATLISPRDGPIDARDKRHLVPFAERRVLGLQPTARPFTAGAAPATPVTAGPLRVGPMICWDALFPDVARDLVAHGADLLAALSSDLDLEGAVPQMIAFSRFRAIETRRWVVRAAGTGQSVAIDPFGRVIDTDLLALPRPIAQPMTFYVRYGEIVPYGAAFLLSLLWLRRYRERRGAPHPERADGEARHPSHRG